MSEPSAFPENLTPSERRTVVALLETGSYKGAARALGIHLFKVNDNLKAAYKKAGVHCSVHLAVAFIRATEVKA